MDCDAFYASIEKRDDPSLDDRPLIIGGGVRGVVSTCCYIARQFGVRSAMPMFTARGLCPDAVVITPNMAKYVEVSRRDPRPLMDALTPLVEPLSIDEAFLDLTRHRRAAQGAACRDAGALCQAASKTRSASPFRWASATTSSSPRSPPTSTSRAALPSSARPKPLAFLAAQPVSLIFGVGKVFAETLQKDGYDTIGQLQEAPTRGADAALRRVRRPPGPALPRRGQPRASRSTAR